MSTLHCRLAAVILAAAAATAASASGSMGPGKWIGKSVDGLLGQGTAPYTSNTTTYAQFDRRNGTWANFTIGPANATALLARGYEPVVRILRNPNASGWDRIDVEALTGTDAFYAAGYAEAFATYDSMYVYHYNILDPLQTMMERPNPSDPNYDEEAFSTFMHAHIAYVRGYATHGSGEAAAATGRFVRQLEGMVAGWNAAYDAAGRPPEYTRRLDFDAVFLISYQGEVYEVLNKFQRKAAPTNISATVSSAVDPLPQMKLRASSAADNWLEVAASVSRCSAFVKIHDRELYFAHATWYLFNSLIRQYKTFRFPQVAGYAAAVHMSSYPGAIVSTDDWMLTSHGLAVLETTVNMHNTSLAKDVVPDSLSLFVRSMYATYTATTPEMWGTRLAFKNSGTYNDEWLVVQMQWAHADLRAGRSLRDGTFHVVTQTPGKVFNDDETARLNADGYRASYNVPLNPAARERLNVSVNEDFYRGHIFARMQREATNLTAVFYLMRYNNWEHDPLSTAPWCNTPWNPNGTVECDVSQVPKAAVAARGDLGTTVPFPSGVDPNWKHAAFKPAFLGALDAKVTTATMFVEQAFATVAVLGPTAVQQPPFDHDLAVARHPEFAQFRWRGLPNTFPYEPLLFTGNATMAPTPDGPPAPATSSSSSSKTVVAVAVALSAALVVVGVFIVVRANRASLSRRSDQPGESSHLMS